MCSNTASSYPQSVPKLLTYITLKEFPTYLYLNFDKKDAKYVADLEGSLEEGKFPEKFIQDVGTADYDISIDILRYSTLEPLLPGLVKIRPVANYTILSVTICVCEFVNVYDNS